MLPALIFTSILCFLLLLLVKWIKLKQYWAKRGVPHLPMYPFIGSLTFLTRCNPTIWMQQVYERFHSPYVGMWLFFRPALIVNDQEIARRVLIKDSINFRDRFVRSGTSDKIGFLSLFSVKDPLWSSIRRRLTVIFTAAKLRSLHSLIEAKSKNLVQRIRIEMDENKRVELRTVFTDYTTDVIGTSAFGVESDSTLKKDSVLRNVTKELMKFSVYRAVSWISVFFFPELCDYIGFTVFPKSSSETVRDVFRYIVEQRGGYDCEIRENRDLLDALRKIKQDAAKDNEDIPEDLLLAQAVIFLQAGFDTTATIITYCIYEITFDPEIQTKLYEELVDHKMKNGGNLDISSLTELKYLNAVIYETLRKHGPMSWMDRVASKDYKIDDNLTITAGTPVYVNAIGIHHDPDIYPDPFKFNPDRFISGNVENIKQFNFLPFGEGPRSCIGRRFAMINLRFAIASIVLNFEARVIPNTPTPREAMVDTRNIFYTPGEPLYVEMIPRC